MSRCLTPSDLRALTGYKRPADQVRWLRDTLHIEPFVSRLGEVTVLWSVVEEAQRRASGMELQAVTRRGPRPRLEAVK